MLISYLFAGVTATTECNGTKYSPLGCFTDEYPFSVEGYRQGAISILTFSHRPIAYDRKGPYNM